MQSWKRTHTCGELRAGNAGQTVTLNGWVNTYRNQGALVFIDLRDRYGITQIVFDQDSGTELLEASAELRSEFVVAVQGEVARRLPGKERKDVVTGEIEIKARAMVVLNRCPTPPFEVTEFGKEELANEDLRLEYRYLDLRRSSVQRRLMLRHRMIKTIRDYLDAQGFLDVETPLLGLSTPEGARDYLVPSRLFHGSWYALPQSPQIYKQLLMVSGFDKYFQIARCLRDEDQRANRQPEFTQLDFEMSFVDQDDVFAVIEGLTAEVFQKCIGVTIPLPLPRLRYADAMLRYGSDKPDLRYGVEIAEISDLAAQTTFQVFQGVLESRGVVRALNAKQAASRFSRKNIDELEQVVKTYGAKGLAWVKVEAEKWNSSIEKFVPVPVQRSLNERLQAAPGDLILFVADKEETVCQALGALRVHLAAALKLYNPADFKIAWVVDFPLFTFDKEEQRWAANHHPFTSPRVEDLERLESDPGSVLRALTTSSSTATSAAAAASEFTARRFSRASSPCWA